MMREGDVQDDTLQRLIVILWCAAGILGLASTPLMLFLGIPLGPMPALIAGYLAVGLFVAGLLLGLFRLMQRDSKRPIVEHPQVYIASVMVMDQKGMHVFDITLHDPTRLRIEVRLIHPGGRVRVVRAPYAVLSQLGEGFVGTAVVQGSWLCGFRRDLVGIQRPMP
jgi:hypothetical protein